MIQHLKENSINLSSSVVETMMSLFDSLSFNDVTQLAYDIFEITFNSFKVKFLFLQFEELIFNFFYINFQSLSDPVFAKESYLKADFDTNVIDLNEYQKQKVNICIF